MRDVRFARRFGCDQTVPDPQKCAGEGEITTLIQIRRRNQFAHAIPQRFVQADIRLGDIVLINPVDFF